MLIETINRHTNKVLGIKFNLYSRILLNDIFLYIQDERKNHSILHIHSSVCKSTRNYKVQHNVIIFKQTIRINCLIDEEDGLFCNRTSLTKNRGFHAYLKACYSYMRTIWHLLHMSQKIYVNDIIITKFQCYARMLKNSFLRTF